MNKDWYLYVDSEKTQSCDLKLKSGLTVNGVKNQIQNRILSLEDKAIKDWLKAQGWATPDEKACLMQALKVIAVWAQNPEPSEADCLELIHDKAMESITKAKGEQRLVKNKSSQPE